MIEAEHLTRRFGGHTAVEDLSFTVDEGEIFGFLGPNGAGKTTTVRMLVCLLAPTSGTARVGGFGIGDGADSIRIRRMIGLVPDNVGLYEELSAYGNLDFYGKLYDCPPSTRHAAIERLLRMLGVWEERDRAVGTFSKGMKQKIAIARAMVHDPQVLFMDEPTANLDPESSKTVRELILQLKAEHKTIVLNTHNLDEAQRLCDRIGILRTRLLSIGRPSELEHAVGGTRTVIELEEVPEGLLAALGGLSLGPIQQTGKTLTFDPRVTDKETPEIVAAVMRAGGRIRSVTRSTPSLEDVYLKAVRDGP